LIIELSNKICSGISLNKPLNILFLGAEGSRQNWKEAMTEYGYDVVSCLNSIILFFFFFLSFFYVLKEPSIFYTFALFTHSDAVSAFKDSIKSVYLMIKSYDYIYYLLASSKRLFSQAGHVLLDVWEVIVNVHY